MGRNAVHKGMNQEVWEALKSEHRPQVMERLVATLEDLHSGCRPPFGLREVLMQPYGSPPKITLEDAYWFAHWVLQFRDGWLVVGQIQVDHRPYLDRMTEENQAILRRMVDVNRDVDDADFWGGGEGKNDSPEEADIRDGDGFIRVVGTRDRFYRFSSDDKVWQPVAMPALDMALEVGHTESTTTWDHLDEDHALARFPYDTKTISLVACYDCNRDSHTMANKRAAIWGHGRRR